MKRIFLPALFLLGLMLAPASAQLKIGVVDYVRVAREYYKTKDAAGKMQERADRAKQEMQDREDDLRKMMVETNKLGEEANDKSLSQQARDEKLKAFSVKRDDFLRERSKYEQEKGEQLRKLQEFDRMTAQEVLIDVTKAVKDYSLREKFSLVLNTGEFGQPYGQLSVITYSNDVKDITDEIIKVVNANKAAAAATVPAATSSPVAVPAAPAAAQPTPAPKK